MGRGRIQFWVGWERVHEAGRGVGGGECGGGVGGGESGGGGGGYLHPHPTWGSSTTSPANGPVPKATAERRWVVVWEVKGKEVDGWWGEGRGGVRGGGRACGEGAREGGEGGSGEEGWGEGGGRGGEEKGGGRAVEGMGGG